MRAGRATRKRYRLICFDEFHVSDIAGAMILGRYLEQVMERGVEFVMTSNDHPDRLVDEFYDERVKLLCSAQAAPEALFTDGGDAKTAAAEFARAVSRLIEMQGAEYLQSERTTR